MSKITDNQKNMHIKLMILVPFYIWEYARVWAYWHYSLHKHLNSLGPVSEPHNAFCSFLHPGNGCNLPLQCLMTWWWATFFVYWNGKHSSKWNSKWNDIPCPQCKHSDINPKRKSHKWGKIRPVYASQWAQPCLVVWDERALGEAPFLFSQLGSMSLLWVLLLFLSRGSGETSRSSVCCLPSPGTSQEDRCGRDGAAEPGASTEGALGPGPGW